jgi:hypothetical protein
MTICIYRVTDSHGNQCVVVADEPSATVHVYGMFTPDGIGIPFETEAYHLPPWAEHEGLTLERFEVFADLDEMAVSLKRCE